MGMQFVTQADGETSQEETFSAKVAHRIREERERLGLNQDEFGPLAGVKRATQIFYEANSRQPNTRYFGHLEQNGIDIAFILCGSRSLPKYNDHASLHYKAEMLWTAFSASIKIANPSASSESIEASLAAFKALCAVCSSQSDPDVLEELRSRLRDK